MAPSHWFHVHSSSTHLQWSSEIAPAMRVPSGAEVTLDLLDGGGNQITRENAAAGTALSSFDFSRADPCVGPVYVEGAEPGDVLRVDVLDVTPAADFAWTAVFPGFGILCEDEEFKEPALKIWDLATAQRDGHLVFRASSPRIEVPYAPFLGVLGLSPAPGAGPHPTVPPMPETGGNIDTRAVTAGSSVFFPVQAAGALLSCGDAHAAQGDGEVCGTAAEMRARTRLRLSVDKGNAEGKRWVRSPWVLTAPAPAAAPKSSGAGETREHMCLGIDPDLREATRKAVRGVVDWLEADKGLPRVEAYMLASVAGNLRMCEVVDMPNYTIGCSVPLSIFVS
ncbi:hypothetical protein GGR52DRAFT_549798 [Hypoxylon sp. FL1284]|nr:hypothetical protein GGR52DRAFT_549798 [Hypoxylon sp. FL1284]